MRTSYKKPPSIPKYGASSKKKRLTKGRKKDSWFDDEHPENLMDKLCDPNSKEFKKFVEGYKKKEAEEDKRRKRYLLKQVPSLKEIKKEVSIELFAKLLTELIDELDAAIRQGRDSASAGSSSGGYSMRADMGNAVPSGSFIVTPYTNYNY